jgi:predicted transcriptional regulator
LDDGIFDEIKKEIAQDDENADWMQDLLADQFVDDGEENLVGKNIFETRKSHKLLKEFGW